MTVFFDDRTVTFYVFIRHQLFKIRLPRWLAVGLRDETGSARAWVTAQVETLARYQQALGNPPDLSRRAVSITVHATALDLFRRRECPDF